MTQRASSSSKASKRWWIVDKLSGTVTDQFGNVIPGATVLITNHHSGKTVELFEDDESTRKANPLSTDERGYWEAMTVPGVYDRTISKGRDSITRTIATVIA